MADFEKLGLFYLGRRYDPQTKSTIDDEPILYDSKDLTTHAVCVGMTGSGKTGLAIALLEEAAIDGVPVIAIDPKGDLGNLLLAFPDLAPGDFRPWIDEAEAERNGRSADEEAAAVAASWREGLARWGQSGERIARYRDAVEATIYTPGSSAGVPLSILSSLAAPAAEVIADEDALRERVASAAASLLGLLGIDADPLRSREHILLATIFERAWRAGENVDLTTLIHAIRQPGFERVGALDLESFYPSRERFELAMALNNLAASPSFSAWLEGQPLDARALLRTDDGKPRLSIISIAHLSDAERMFVVTLVLGELISWMRAQPGTSSLRAILYMDEVFGFFPPVANPPSKTPMLTLLKQARAYGVGVMLATQNPVDLDYKGLANAGTWLLGRLQTERDKARVIEGLEGASAASGASFDRAQMERTLSGLDKRVFVLHNVHESEPVVFQSRWALSYLAGPLTRAQIQRLREARRAGAASAAEPSTQPASTAQATSAPAAVSQAAARRGGERPVLPPDVPEAFLPAPPDTAGAEIVYRPALLATATLHYADARNGIDEWRKLALLTELADGDPDWAGARRLGDTPPALASQPASSARFAALPAAASRAQSYPRWSKAFAAHLQQSEPLRVLQCRQLKLVARANQSEAEFRARVADAARELRDAEMEKLRRTYAPKVSKLETRLRAAGSRIDRERAQYEGERTQSAISLGATVLGAVFGRKLGLGTMGRATTAARSVERAARQHDDVTRAKDQHAEIQVELSALGKELEAKLDELRATFEGRDFGCETLEIAPRKSDLTVDRLSLVWVPKMPGLE